jgi:hypothetical protein
MSDAHDHTHADPAAEAPPFRFEAFADAPSAQAAFAAAYPAGSAIEAALRALVGRGAQCKSVGATRFACRYVESGDGLAGLCWHVMLEAGSDQALRRASIALAILGI